MTPHALGLDLLVVLVFAAMGRASHDLELGVLGVLATAWPFVVGTAVGWLCHIRLPRGVRRWWMDGVVVAVCALVLGMVLRWLTGAGTAVPFVLVATGVLVAGLLGWRAVEALVVRRRTRTPQPAGTAR